MSFNFFWTLFLLPFFFSILQANETILVNEPFSCKEEFEPDTHDYILCNSCFNDVKLDSLKKKKSLVKNEYGCIKYFHNPSEELQMALIKSQPWDIGFIEHPHPNVQMYYIKRSPQYILNIKNPTEEVQLYAIEHDWKSLYSIKNPTLKVQKRAIKLNPRAIEYIENPSNEIKAYFDSVRISSYSKDNLMWLIEFPATHRDISMKKISQYVTKINSNPELYGYNNWRLPTEEELMGLAYESHGFLSGLLFHSHEERHRNNYLDTTVFFDHDPSKDTFYWTSTKCYGKEGTGYVALNFNYPPIKRYKIDFDGPSICVHGPCSNSFDLGGIDLDRNRGGEGVQRECKKSDNTLSIRLVRNTSIQSKE